MRSKEKLGVYGFRRSGFEDVTGLKDDTYNKYDDTTYTTSMTVKNAMAFKLCA